MLDKRARVEREGKQGRTLYCVPIINYKIMLLGIVSILDMAYSYNASSVVVKHLINDVKL